MDALMQSHSRICTSSPSDSRCTIWWYWSESSISTFDTWSSDGLCSTTRSSETWNRIRAEAANAPTSDGWTA